MNSEPRPCLFDIGFPLPEPQVRTSSSDLIRHALHTRRLAPPGLLVEPSAATQRYSDPDLTQKLGQNPERKGGIAAFDRLVWQVVTKEPYASAGRVFWIVDNGSDHRGKASIKRLQRRWRNLILVHLPGHASWLNQVKIYHSIIQRKVLAPNDVADTAEGARTLNEFEHHYNEIAKPVEWHFTRDDLIELLDRIDPDAAGHAPAAIAA